MNRLLTIIDVLSLLAALMAGISLAALVTLGGAEIVLRSFFSTSLSFVVELNGYLLAVAFLGGAAQAMREGGHIRVTMVPQTLPPRSAKLLDIACTVVGTALGGALFASMVMLAYGSYTYGSLSFYPSRTPLFIPQSLVAVMLLIFVLALAARLLRILSSQAVDVGSTTSIARH